MKYTTLETERLLLRPTMEEDAEFIFALMNTPKWIQNIGDRNIQTVQDAAAYIRYRMLPQLKRLGHSNCTIIRKIDQQKIGCCGLYDREGLEGVDIGFSLLPDYEKKGYGFEAANRIKQFAIEQLDIKKISGITTKENLASQRLLERLDLKLIGTTQLPNDDEELLLYQLELD